MQFRILGGRETLIKGELDHFTKKRVISATPQYYETHTNVLTENYLLIEVIFQGFKLFKLLVRIFGLRGILVLFSLAYSIIDIVNLN